MSTSIIPNINNYKIENKYDIEIENYIEECLNLDDDFGCEIIEPNSEFIRNPTKSNKNVEHIKITNIKEYEKLTTETGLYPSQNSKITKKKKK